MIVKHILIVVRGARDYYIDNMCSIVPDCELTVISVEKRIGKTLVRQVGETPSAPSVLTTHLLSISLR